MTAPLKLVAEGETADTLTLAAACDALGVSASTLRRWVESGRVHALRTPGGHRRFRASEIRRLASESGSAPLSAISPPDHALPRAGELLSRAAGRLAVQAARSIYLDADGGWFSSPAAAIPLGHWGDALARACRAGAYEAAATSTLEIMRRSRVAGTSLLERQMWLERASDVLVRAAMVHQIDKLEVRELRRLLLSLRHRVLQAEDRGPASSSASAA